ncbi:MAG: phosphate-starvation-inducible PsiE family protein [Hyphomicrobiaceae bacterium]|nr:phosphate-starvation-inducible PsiE family protein [Hyphomicrobiaceae bacterium]
MEKQFRRVEQQADIFGHILVRSFHLLALFAIGAATVWSALQEFLGMVAAGRAEVGDILLLFIYLELGAMVGIYFMTNRMPVRFLIYVGITALTRLMIEEISKTHDADDTVLIICASILLLAVAVLILRIGSVKFPDPGPAEEYADKVKERARTRTSKK